MRDIRSTYTLFIKGFPLFSTKERFKLLSFLRAVAEDALNLLTNAFFAVEVIKLVFVFSIHQSQVKKIVYCGFNVEIG